MSNYPNRVMPKNCTTKNTSTGFHVLLYVGRIFFFAMCMLYD